MLLTRMSEHQQFKKVNKEPKDPHDNSENNQYFLENMNTPSELNDIKPRANHKCNCDEIGFDPI